MRFVDTSVFYSRSEKVAVRKEQDIVAGIAFPENPETFGKFMNLSQK